MLSLFAAAGHCNYVKSSYLYLRNMSQFETKHPDAYKKFQLGYHVIQYTNKSWVGFGSDVAIEQTLMRSLKSSGGATHGSEMTEEQRFLWTMSSQVCSAYNFAMSDFNKRAFSASEQHKDLTEARLKKDRSDLLKIREKLKLHSPFTDDFESRNIITCV